MKKDETVAEEDDPDEELLDVDGYDEDEEKMDDDFGSNEP